jgi:hypothetical protein
MSSLKTPTGALHAAGSGNGRTFGSFDEIADFLWSIADWA